MRTSISVLILSTALAPACLLAQSSNPVATAFRADAAGKEKNIVAAAEAMPAADYDYKPTAEQMTFADVVMHVAEGNDYLCGDIGGHTVPPRSRIAATDGKEALVARLKATFQTCDAELASLDDSKLDEPLPFFGGRKMSRAGVMTVTTGDWADHYSQMAIYLRLKGQLPPTAKKP